MIIPSIDLAGGHAVQLVGGRDLALDAGDPRPFADRFGVVGEIAVVDLDAALGRGENRDIIEELCKRARCRVGGGIRSAAAAIAWLERGATRVVLGTAATPEVLAQLPRERVIVALDAVDGEVVVDGWRTRTGESIEARLQRLRELAGGFLVTCVEREGRLAGVDLPRATSLRQAAADAELTFAGGVATAAEVGQLDALGIDAQVGMALYKEQLDLGDAVAATLHSDRPDGLWPTVVVDTRGIALGLAWSDRESLSQAIRSRRGIYRSRRRGLWVKGETSGAHQDLLRVDVDCDRDALRFVVRQHGAGFCHRDTHGCWGPAAGLNALEHTVATRVADAPPGSYTRTLFDDPALLAAKLGEEASELAEAQGTAEVRWEAADVAYFTTVAMARSGVSWAEVEAELDRRALLPLRRHGPTEESR